MSLAEAIQTGERQRLMEAVPGYAIEGVPADKAMVPWTRCWSLLERAVKRYCGTDKWTEDELLRQIKAGQCQLWIAWSYDRRRIDGAIATRIILDPPGLPAGDKFCDVMLIGGDNGREWLPGMLGLLKAWAREQGCSHLGGPARPGWKRLLGFREVGRTPEGLPILVLPVRRH